MNRKRLLFRVGFAVLTVYVALSAMFFLVTFAPDTAMTGTLNSRAFASQDMNVSQIEAAKAQWKQTYMQARGLDRPLHVRYLGWLADMTTLQWGASFSLDAPVSTLVADRLERTLGYAIPGFLLASVFGVLTGLYAALERHSVSSHLLRGVAYVVFGVPNFWLAALATGVLAAPPVVATIGDRPVLVQRVVPALLLSTTLVAGQLSYTRAESLEQIGERYIQFLRAKGLGPLQVTVRVLKNAAVPLLTLFFTDLLAVFVVAIYVIEFALDIPGFGQLTYVAARERDMPLLLGTAVVVVVTGVVGNFLQDVAYGILDPRTRGDDR